MIIISLFFQRLAKDLVICKTFHCAPLLTAADDECIKKMHYCHHLPFVCAELRSLSRALSTMPRSTAH